MTSINKLLREGVSAVNRWTNDEQGRQLDWSKPSLAVVASTEESAIILWTAGPHVAMEIEMLSAEEVVGLLEGYGYALGIWVWEGVSRWVSGSGEYQEEGEMLLEGDFRQPTAGEWAAIREGRCPWPSEDWVLKEGDAEMCEKPDEETKESKPGPLVEDTTVAGGTDKETGAPVIRPKKPDGKVDEDTEPTDPSEKAED